MNTDGTVTDSELTGKAGPALEFKGDARLLLFTHGALLALLAYLLIGYVRPLAKTLLGALPEHFLVVLNLANFLNDYATIPTLWPREICFRMVPPQHYSASSG